MEWNESAINDVKRMWSVENRSAGEIAKAVGRTRSAVLGKLKRLGLLKVRDPKPKPPKPPPKPKIRTQKTSRRVMPSKPLRTFTAPPPAGTPCTIVDLTPDACRWPMWDDNSTWRSDDFGLYCGGQALVGCPYCDAHSRIAWQARR